MGLITILSPFSKFPPNATSLYPMNDGSGQTLTDTSGHANNGFLGSSSGSDSNDPAWTAAGNSYIVQPSTDTTASGDYATLPAASVPSTAWTIIAVAKSDSSGAATQRPFGVRYDASNSKILTCAFGLSNQNMTMTTWNGSTTTSTNITANSGWLSNTWAMCAISFTKATGAVTGTCITANVLSQASISNATGLTSCDVFRVGNVPTATSQPMSGGLAYVLVYPRVLTNSELWHCYRLLKRRLAGRSITL